MKVINIRENPEYKDSAISYFQEKWANDSSKAVYDDCITRSIITDSTLPIWYILIDEDKIIGCVGLITNDFISCMDLWPWLCAMYIEKDYRGNAYGSLLIEQLKQDVGKASFDNVYLATNHIGYYEKYGFEYICDGYHPWGDVSRVYKCKV